MMPVGSPHYRFPSLLASFLLAAAMAACSPPPASPGAQSALQIAAVPVTYGGEIASFDNGNMVEFPFLDTYKSMQGERWLGRPFTRAFADPDLGWTMQIFEYGVLAQDPGDGHIFLLKISDLLSRRQAGVPVRKNPPVPTLRKPATTSATNSGSMCASRERNISASRFPR